MTSINDSIDTLERIAVLRAERMKPGLCSCGCGTKTRLAPHSRVRTGWVKGEPIRSLQGHGHGKDPLFGFAVGGGCWVWQGRLMGGGYGICYDRSQRREVPAHRWVYERLKEPIPMGLQLDHLCRNRACVNPAHLEPVTAAENQRRGLNTKLTRESVALIRRTKGQRQELAARFGIDPQYVDLLRRGINWRDVA